MCEECDKSIYHESKKVYSDVPSGLCRGIFLCISSDEDMPAKSFKLSYTQGNSATAASSDFNYYGYYQISVIHICQEYAVLSQGGSTSSATLVDVKGNIDGGYGVFTGISRVTKTISVSRGSSPF